jgi:hypothetical protein
LKYRPKEENRRKLDLYFTELISSLEIFQSDILGQSNESNRIESNESFRLCGSGIVMVDAVLPDARTISKTEPQKPPALQALQATSFNL